MAKRKLTVAQQKEKKLRKKKEKVPRIAVPQPERAVRRFDRGMRDVLRALKKAKSFERQRMAKRIATDTKAAARRMKLLEKRGFPVAKDVPAVTEAADQKLARLQRAVEMLKILDLEVAAHVHLAHSMLRIPALVEAPGPLAAHLQTMAEPPAGRKQRGDATDVHNVTSALYNRAIVRESVAKAVSGMCQLLCVPVPERYQRHELSKAERKRIKTGQDQFADSDSDMEIIDDVESEDEEEDEEEEEEKEKKEKKEESETKNKTEKRKKDKKDKDKAETETDDASDVEERALAQFASRLGGSDSDSDSDSDDVEAMRAKYKQALAEGPAEGEDEESDEGAVEEAAAFYMDETPAWKLAVSGSEDSEGSDSEDSEDSEEDGEEDDNSDNSSDSDSDSDAPPRKRQATDASKGRTAADARFLPTLMGGYVSDGGGSSDEAGRRDDDEAATRMLAQRKNRRGQRARRAIWEKKFKEQARHVQAEAVEEAAAKKAKRDKKDKKDQKDQKFSKGATSQDSITWDAKRGAVDANDGPRWMRRKLAVQSGSLVRKAGEAIEAQQAKEPKKEPKKDEPLHPSWAAAKKAKEKAQSATFSGKKITFD